MDLPPGCIIEGTKFVKCPQDFAGDFTIPVGIERVGVASFYFCKSLTGVHIPDGVNEIGWNAFRGCVSLTSVHIPDGCTRIGTSAFNSCDNLTSVRIPDGVTSIDSYAFGDCPALSSVHIPESVTVIAGCAFQGCDSLSVAIIPKTCDVAEDAFPASCKIFKGLAEYRTYLAKKLADERAGDGVEIVGMHTPQFDPPLDGSSGRDI